MPQPFGENPMTDAVEAGDLTRVIELIRRQPKLASTFAPRTCDGDDTDQTGRPGEELWLPLHRAAVLGHTAIAQALLDAGAHPDGRTRFDTPDRARATALHWAAWAGQADIVDLLLVRGAELDLMDFQNATPLAYAALAGQPATARRLIERGANLEARDAQGCTPLLRTIAGGPRWAAQRDQHAVAILLIDAGADVNATNPKDNDRFTALHACVHEGPHRLETARRLLEAGADVAALDPESRLTPAQYAQTLVRLGHREYAAFVDLLSG